MKNDFCPSDLLLEEKERKKWKIQKGANNTLLHNTLAHISVCISIAKRKYLRLWNDFFPFLKLELL